MSENDSKTKVVAGKAGWTDHEVTAPVPEGRNISGCRQKINRIKIALKSEMDALKAGEAIADPASTVANTSPTKKPVTPRKRKVKTDEADADSEATPKKTRGRPKKQLVAPEVDGDNINVKVDPEVSIEDDV
ncbi:hypothetical protein PTMSG1_00433 [Pyrenophora teres f. maculata]|nr:hypothetical protein PTMSG1_00433 [Pyrenophora teres f. maculata]